MRSLLLTLSLVGCAHATESVATVQSSQSTTPTTAPSHEVIAVDQQEPEQAAPPARPRLTQTITLGQSNGAGDYAPMPSAAAQGQGGGTNVIVNNNVIVQNQPPAFYGGYGYGGYGYGYGSRGGYGVRTDGSSRGGHSTGTATWGATGWEGAQGRPAAAGATPSVGGNWSSAPSYGPRQMK